MGGLTRPPIPQSKLSDRINQRKLWEGESPTTKILFPPKGIGSQDTGLTNALKTTMTKRKARKCLRRK
jgi:hypothetical protein